MGYCELFYKNRKTAELNVEAFSWGQNKKMNNHKLEFELILPSQLLAESLHYTFYHLIIQTTEYLLNQISSKLLL